MCCPVTMVIDCLSGVGLYMVRVSWCVVMDSCACVAA